MSAKFAWVGDPALPTTPATATEAADALRTAYPDREVYLNTTIPDRFVHILTSRTYVQTFMGIDAKREPT